jgi:cytochrome P450
MLNGKLYIINSPNLVQGVIRSSTISFDPFLIEFSEGTFGLTKKQVEIIARREVMDDLVEVIHATLMGEPLMRLNLAALNSLMEPLNAIRAGTPLSVADTSVFLRRHLMAATMEGLFGKKHNPFPLDKVDLLYAFDKGSILLALGLPSFVAPEATAARAKLYELLLPFYEGHHDQADEVSDIVKKRAAVLRKSGYSDYDLGTSEIIAPWVGTTNSVPTHFWLFLRVFSDPDYLARVRAEAEAAASFSDGTREARLGASNLEKSCPFLYACYQEVLRCYLHGIGNRRVMEDTRLQDAEDDGREYLLKQGVNVQIPTGVLHHLGSAWGPDAHVFNPERWLKPVNVGTGGASSQDDKKRRRAFMPFGGGRHLCPGRRFATAELLGFTAVMAAGFDVEGVELPADGDPSFGAAPRRPLWNGESQGMKVSRRKGWENVIWKFVQ